MATSKTLLVQLVWTTVICGQVVVFCKPQGTNSAGSAPASKLDGDHKDGAPLPPGVTLGKTKGFEVKHGYSFNVAASPDGSPYSQGYAYLGGRTGAGPTYYRDGTAFSPSDIWNARSLDVTSASLYTVAAAVGVGSLLYAFAPYITAWSTPTSTPLTKSSPKPSKPVEVKKAEDNKEGIVLKEKDGKKEVPKNNEATSKSSRTRRDLAAKNTVQPDAELTRLASIVLNAIASGECLQKTICQVGTQLGASPKGRVAFQFIDNLLPASVHSNQYFITMKKALRGETICEKFNCQYSI